MRADKARATLRHNNEPADANQRVFYFSSRRAALAILFLIHSDRDISALSAAT